LTAPVAAEEMRAALAAMEACGASDLHLSPGRVMRVRVDGTLRAKGEAIPPAGVAAMVRSVLPPGAAEELSGSGEADFAWSPGARSNGPPRSGTADSAAPRYRFNVFRCGGETAAAIRRVPPVPPSLSDLGLPGAVRDLALLGRGLVLVTGATGSGKSTTLAGMIGLINSERDAHVLTIEDPVEFVYESRRCLVRQREVGRDTAGFASALRSALRQDPDVIMVGEARDPDTIQAALTAAETGHLVLTTLHTGSASESVSRLIDAFPAGERDRVRAQTASVLEGVVSQTLLPRASGRGRVAACEILRVTAAVRALIREDRGHQIGSSIQAGRRHGMQSLNDALAWLCMSGEVTPDTCLSVSPNPAGLKRKVELARQAGG